MPVSAASYGSIPLSPAVSFLAQFAEATSPSTFGNQENRLGTEGDQIGNYVLGRLLGRGAFSSVVEGWTAETGRSFDGESFGHVAIKVVPKESSPASVRVSSASNLASLGSAPDFGSFHSALGLGLARSRGTPPSQLSRDTPEPEPSQEALDREIAIWQRLKHPNITRMIEVLDTELATYIVCEFANGGSLFQLLQQHREGVPERVAWHLFRQIVEGVRYLHEDVSVCHGDLKLENVLLHSDRERQGRWEIAESLAMLRELVDLSTEDLERVQVKITDFGLSEYIGSPSPHRGESGFLAGTLPYVAPELFRRNPAGSPRSGATHNRASSTSRFEQSSANLLTKSRSQADLGMSSLIGSAAMLVSPGQDVWAAAVVLFALLTGTLPFQDDFAPRLQLKITRGQYDEGLLGQRGVTFGAREVIRRCLHVKEAERWTIRQLVESTWVSSGPSY